MSVPFDVEIRHLAAFRAVCEHRSFGRAAEALGYSQAAVSQQIGALERTVGLPLFERPGGPRPVVPTEAARQLLPYADTIFRQLDGARLAMDEVATGERGRLAIGSFESVSVALLPRIVGVLTRERPDLELHLTEDHSSQFLAGRVLDGDLDASFVPEAPDLSGLTARELLVDPYMAVMPATDERTVLRLADLAESPLVGHGEDDSCQLHINLALRSAGVSPHYVFRSNDNGALQAMVRSGLGVALMPLLAIDVDDAGVRVIPTDPAVPARHVTLIWRDDREPGPALARFVEIADEVVGEVSMARAS